MTFHQESETLLIALAVRSCSTDGERVPWVCLSMLMASLLPLTWVSAKSELSLRLRIIIEYALMDYLMLDDG